MRYLMCDFETIVSLERTRVWAWAVCDIYEMTLEFGNSLETFLEYVSRETTTCYFHNLKFDGTFIVDYLLRHNFAESEGKKINTGEFSTLIGDMGQWYSMKVKIGKVTVTFLDSLKIIPMSVEAIPKAFGIPERKLEMDYLGNREEGHELTKEEKDYIQNDVVIVAKALRIIRDEGHHKMTASSNAMADLKAILSEYYSYYFPILEISVDKDCRKSYKGGWSYVNPKYQDMMVGEGQVYDVNSMYPHVMRSKPLPYGEPIFYTGEYEQDDLYDCFICSIEVEFKLKAGHYPSIQAKNSPFYKDTDYLTETTAPTLLTLTSVDYGLLLENYDIISMRHICGYKMKSMIGIFKPYIDKWYKVKTDAKLEGNSAYASLAKLFLNGCYGKLGANPIKRRKIPYLNTEKDIVAYKMSNEEVNNTGYVPVASFVTSWARDIIIRAANACGDRFLYADTDSLHILGSDPPNINISETELGAFKLESKFQRAKYLRAKCYIEEDEGSLDKKCAGLPKKCRGDLNFDTLKIGSAFHGKLVPKPVPGGTVLVERDFVIR